MLAIHLCQTGALEVLLYVKGDSSQEGKKKLFILLSHKMHTL